MSESIQIREPLHKLLIRFGNGETINYILTDPLDARLMTPETKYVVISSFSVEKPSECTDVTVINVRDLTFIRTERVTLDQLTGERRMAGMRSTNDDKIPKTLAQLKFI
ncbi:MAG TPA: hypothetical protein VNS63_05380 [Blastocatellia bacterium]|nr:hypothetical protein [Blastocatellia bacterium]